MVNDGVSYTSYEYTDENGFRFTCWDKYPDCYRLSYSHIFDYYDNSVLVRVGLYDINDNIIEHFEMYLFVKIGKGNVIDTSTGGPMVRPVGQNKKVAKIMNHLFQGQGYVRFVAPIYGGATFDLKVPCRSK